MKKLLIGTLLSTLTFTTYAQEETQKSTAFSPRGTIKWAPAGLAVGNISLQGEYAVGRKTSLTVKFGIPAKATHAIEFDGDDADFEMKATSFMTGYRIYLSKKELKGIYFEPFVKYVHHTAEGVGTSTLAARTVTMHFTNSYDAYGIGAQLGAQFRVAKRIAIDLFLIGPEINSARNNFKAVEASSTIPWTFIEAQDAEREVKNFIDDFPFVRNRTTVTADRENKTIMAKFKGALPGFRTGISFGFAF